jgi:transcriptional regulator with XRE-family HTH domain
MPESAAPAISTRPPRRSRRGAPRYAAADAGRWAELVKLVGWHVYSLRDLLHVSQEELARLAGVSQGGISRMESGRCLDMPLVSYAKVAAAFCRELGPLRDRLTPDVRAVLHFTERVLAVEGLRSPLALFEDPTLQHLIGVYEQLPGPDRAAYAEVLETLGRWMLARLAGGRP